MKDLSIRVEDASAQSAALGDALAGSFQQYAMVSQQIYGLKAETDGKLRQTVSDVETLNATLGMILS